MKNDNVYRTTFVNATNNLMIILKMRKEKKQGHIDFLQSLYTLTEKLTNKSIDDDEFNRLLVQIILKIMSFCALNNIEIEPLIFDMGLEGGY